MRINDPQITWQLKLWVLISFSMCMFLTKTLYAESSPELIDREENYLRKLRTAGLYEVVEGYLTRKLAEPRLPDDLRTLYVLELGRAFADHATTVPGKNQQLYWQQAHDILTKELTEHPENSLNIKIKVEQGCLLAVKVDFYCKVLELVTDTAPYKNQINSDGTTAIMPLELLLKQLAEQIKTTSQTSQIKGTKLFQLQALELKSKYELARLHLNLAQLNPDDQVEFTAHIIQAEKILRQLTVGWTDEILTQQAWVQLARLNRLKTDERGFQVMKKGLAGVAVPDNIYDQLIAEETQYLLLEGKLLEAEALARERLQFKQGERQAAVELVVWHLMALKQLAELATKKGNPALAEDLQKQIQLRRDRLIARGDAYWIDWLKVRDQRQELKIHIVPEFAQMVQQAETQFRAGQLKESAGTYHQLAQQALQRQKVKEACEWGYTALSILATQKQWSQIATIAAEIYPQVKTTPQANEIHFLWLLAEQQLLPQPWQKSAAMEAHVARLQVHLELYGNETTASRVRFFLGTVGDQLGMNPSGVRRFYLDVSPEDAEYHTALKRACRSLLNQGMMCQKDQLPSLVAEWEKDFTTIKESYQQKSMSVQMIETQLEFLKCQILLGQHTSEAINLVSEQITQIEQWLHNVKVSRPLANESMEAHQLLQEFSKLIYPESQAVKSLVMFAARDVEHLKQQIKQLGDLNAESLLELIRLIDRCAQRGEQERTVQFQVAELELMLFKLLEQKPAKFSDVEQQLLLDIKIKALSQIGRYPEARKLLEEELAKHPERKHLAEQLIVMYLENGSPQSLEEALVLIKKMEAEHKAGTETWLTYRLLLLETGIKQGKAAETKKLWQLTTVLYPKSGTEAQRKKLRELGDKLK